MNRLLIAYDLHKLGQRYAALRKLVHDNFHTRWACLESTFIVITPMTPAQVRDLLSPALDRNDELLVIELVASSWATLGFPQNCIDWLRQNT